MAITCTALTPDRQAASNGVPVVLASQTTPASMAALLVGIYTDTPATVSAVSDSKGNSYSYIGTPALITGNKYLRLAYALNALGGAAHTWSLTLTGTTGADDPVLILPNYMSSGTGAISFDQGVKTENGFVGATYATGTLTPGGSNAGLLAFTAEDSINDNTPSWAATGFSLRASLGDQTVTFPDYLALGGASFFAALASPAATSTTITKNSGGSNAATILASFLEAAAPGSASVAWWRG